MSMVWLVSGALWSPLEMLGHDQPRDSHVHGAPHARAEPSAQLMQCEPGVCASRTATKYRNTTTATRHPAGLRAAVACSVANMVVIAGSSGRRGRRFKSCHPDQCFCRSAARTGIGEGFFCCQYSSKIRPVQQRLRTLTCSSKGLPLACAALRWSPSGRCSGETCSQESIR